MESLNYAAHSVLEEFVQIISKFQAVSLWDNELCVGFIPWDQ